MSASVRHITQEGKDALFRQGLRYYDVDDWQGALRVFRELHYGSHIDDPQSNLYASYHGLVRVRMQDDAGLMLCRQAAAYEEQLADVFHNLAQAESLMNYRRHAYRALAQGLEMEPRHSGLLRLQQRLGRRRKPIIGFLNREHFLNRWLGKLTYSPSPGNTGRNFSHAS